MSQPDQAPLAGYRVAVTAARRAEELCTLLRRYGATVSAAAAITMVNLPDDELLRSNTEALIANPPDILVVTTAVGFRGWMDAAEGWGLGAGLIGALSGVRILSRGPKATGALRAAGLPEEWSPESESSAEVLRYLLTAGVAGRRIALQIHGTLDFDPAPELLDGLHAAGADVVEIRVYRWLPAPRGGEFDQLVTEIAQRQFDGVAFTSAPAVVSLLQRADELSLGDEVAAALRGGVRPMCVGPITARPLTLRGIPSSSPERMRLGALARHIIDELPAERIPALQAAGYRIEIRSTCVVVDDEVKPLSPSGMAILRALAQQPGAVVSRDNLLRVLPGNSSDPHAVDTAMLRLRTTLGDKKIINTVVKRGYRLAIDAA